MKWGWVREAFTGKKVFEGRLEIRERVESCGFLGGGAVQAEGNSGYKSLRRSEPAMFEDQQRNQCVAGLKLNRKVEEAGFIGHQKKQGGGLGFAQRYEQQWGLPGGSVIQSLPAVQES